MVHCGLDVTVVPAWTPADEVLAMDPEGIFLSNGPGDPAAVSLGLTIAGNCASEGALDGPPEGGKRPRFHALSAVPDDSPELALLWILRPSSTKSAVPSRSSH